MDISTIDISMNQKPSKTNPDLRLLEEFGAFRRALNLYFTNALRSVDLGVKQASLLRFLAKRGKASLAELSRDTLTDPAAMTRLVTVLLKQGVIRQKEHATDKRCWELALTPQGQKMAAEVEKIYQRLAETILENLSVEEKSGFSKILQKLSLSLSNKKRNPSDGLNK